MEKEGIFTSGSEDSFKSLDEIRYELAEKQRIYIDEASIPSELSYEEFFDEAKRRQEFRERAEGESRSVDITIPSDRPIAIAFLSDLHLGSGGVDYDLIRETAQLIKEHPLAYCITGGDLTDCLFFDYGEEVFNMQEQYVGMYKMLQYIGGENILAGILGNHESWARKQGVHSYMEFRDKTKRPLLRGISYVNLTVGDQLYKILCSHKLRGHSYHNANHPQGRANKEIQGADIIMSAHTHTAGEQNAYQTEFGGRTRKVVFLNGKTFKKLDAYGKDQAYIPTTDDRIGCNWIILSPDRRMIRTASSNEEMVETMQHYF